MGRWVRNEDRWLTRRIQSIDINTQIYRFCHADSIPDLLDDTLRSNGVDFSSLDDLETAVAIVVIIAKTG